MNSKVKFRTAVIPENRTIVCTIIIMTILEKLKPMEIIRNLQSRDTGNFGNKTHNKDKRENKKNPTKTTTQNIKKKV